MEKPGLVHRKPHLDFFAMGNYVEYIGEVNLEAYAVDLEVHDFWNWLCESHWHEISNDTFQYFDLNEMLLDANTPTWAYDILRIYHGAFEEFLDADGGVEVFVSW